MDKVKNRVRNRIMVKVSVRASLAFHNNRSVIIYKKFGLRLTRRKKAYSSSCLQTVNLSPTVFTKDWPTTVK